MDGFAMLPIWIAVFALSGSIHEFAHAWSAMKLGDDTAERQGRVTLNPIAHVDPLGLVVLIISSLAGAGFGWMKPVPVNPYALSNPKRDMMLISAAGPVSNILQALLFLIIAILFQIPLAWEPGLPIFFTIAITLNLLLAAFNLIPLPPLDGFKVAAGLLPHRASIRYEDWVGKYGPLLLVAIFLFAPVRNLIMGPIMFVVEGVVFGLARFLTGNA